MSKTRDNHYVPQWYQKGFFKNDNNKICYLSLAPQIYPQKNGEIKEVYSKKWYHPSQCFYKTDLYTTFFGAEINDDIERVLFGQIDDIGSTAIRAFISGDPTKQHYNYENFFVYIDAQKIRTPKGLDWIQNHYPKLNQLELMNEMQSIRTMHCTLWAEGVCEIVSAKGSDVKFIISDHPITVYNYACPPDSAQCRYPNDPDIAFKASQTIYPLDQNHALILTNLEYAKDPEGSDPLAQRTHAKRVRQSMIRTDAVIRSRNLETDDVTKINFIIKSRAKQFIAAGKDEWLYPEKQIQSDWVDFREVLMPPSDQMFLFGGEIYVGYEDGSTRYQDEFGRTKPESDFLKKEVDESSIRRNDPCGCGSGEKYKKCCINIPIEQRTLWKVLSIRERNINLYAAIYGILGLDNGKTWKDVRCELSNDQIRDIYSVYSILWPAETDIYELLPKPDNRLRALYTGIIDVRTINTALSMTSYFDEILIQHPFVNPNNVKPEFSPTESPDKYKHQALKDIFFLLNIEPFVISGMIKLIPDPCNFDYNLHREMLDMAEQRKGLAKLSTRDKNISYELSKEDLFRTMITLPEDMKDKQIRSGLPNISAEELEKLKLHWEALAEKDPLTLLQELDLDNGGQFLITNMAPNYEMTLFTAQITGSMVITDSESRWFEFQQAQSHEKGIVIYPWQQLSSAISEIVLYMETDDIIENFSDTNFVGLKRALNDLKSIVRDGSEDADSIARIEQQLTDCLSRIIYESGDERAHLAKMHTLIPKGGFVDRHVQRLLMKSNCESYLDSVSMVMYVETPIQEKS